MTSPSDPNFVPPLDRLDGLGITFIDDLPDGPLTTPIESTSPVEERGLTDEEALLFLAGVRESVTAAANVDAMTGEVHTGAMIALVPSSADKARMAVPDGEPMDVLHATLVFLGEAAEISPDVRREVVDRVRELAQGRQEVLARGFAVALFNPDRDEPCWVLEVGETDPARPLLTDLHAEVETSVGRVDGLTLPPQHVPWRPHVTLVYDGSTDWAYELVDAAGPLTFDTLRVAFGGEVTDFALVTPSSPDAAALYSTATDNGGTTMPYHAARRAECPVSEPWAVVKDSDGSILACHPTKEAANAQIAAIHAHENAGRTITFTAGHMRVWQGGSVVASDGPPPNVEAALESESIADAPIVDLTGEDELLDGTVQPVGSWEGVLAVEGTPTGDGRQFSVGALTWAELPIPLLWQKQVIGEGHMGQVTAGSITYVWRDGTLIRARGTFDLNGDDGSEAYRQVREGFLQGLSIDPDSITDSDVELVFPEEEGEGDLGDFLFGPAPELTIFHAGRIRATTLVQIPAFVEAKLWLTDGMQVTQSLATTGGVDETHYAAYVDGAWDAGANQARLARVISTETATAAYAVVAGDDQRVKTGEVPRGANLFLHHEVDEHGHPGAANVSAVTGAIARLNADTSLDRSTRQVAYAHLAAHVRAAGLVPLPLTHAESLVAASHTIVISDLPPAEWFAEPVDVTPHGALTVTDEGRVYGYLAPAQVAHRSFSDRRVYVPMKNVDYSRFMGRETIVAGGGRVLSGCVTMNCGHASTDPHVTGDHALQHYDNSCSIVASVCVGENAHGVWVAGSLLPGVTADDVTRMMACQLSGDWRPLPDPVNGKVRELAGALLVPVPGFPMSRSRPTVRVDEVGLVASAVPVRFVRTAERVVAAAGENALHGVAQRIARGIGRDAASRAQALKVRIHTGR